jgi:DNA-binding CsgD family transcriptional regulator
MPGVPFRPTTDPRVVLASLPPIGANGFHAMVSNPHQGVVLATRTGQVLFANEQAAKLMDGPAAKARRYVGKHWAEFMPTAWVRERTEMVDWVHANGRPIRVRTLWRDHQVLSWISPIVPGDGFGAGVVRDAEPMVLIVTHRQGRATEELVAADGFAEVHSRFVRLDRLDRLSARELEVLSLLGKGLSIQEVARALSRSEKTIDRHRDAIHAKLGITDRGELMLIADRAALEPDDVTRERV